MENLSNVKAEEVGRSELALTIKDLCVSYDGGDKPALDGVSLQANLGEMLLVVGPNGGGKTTLLKTIAGILRPFKGSIFVLGRNPVNDLKVRKFIGYMPQVKEINISAPLTVRDLVSFGRFYRLKLKFEKDDLEIVDKCISMVGLQDEAEKRISSLSGGQLSRAMIAKVLAQDPLVYLLDEPFESIDNPTKSLIMRILESEKRKGKLIILAAHYIADLEKFDRLILFNKRVVSERDPKNVNSKELSSLLLESRE